MFSEHEGQLACVDCNFRDEITDIINNPEELLDLLFVEMCVRNFNNSVPMCGPG